MLCSLKSLNSAWGSHSSVSSPVLIRPTLLDTRHSPILFSMLDGVLQLGLLRLLSASPLRFHALQRFSHSSASRWLLLLPSTVNYHRRGHPIVSCSLLSQKVLSVRPSITCRFRPILSSMLSFNPRDIPDQFP